jgi:pimeloyl-ACP methyl ester carboxylesterase
VVAALLAASLTGAATRTVASAKAVRVGGLTLTRCSLEQHTVSAYCGSIKVPLNYRSDADGQITVGFGWLPASAPVAGPAQAPTIVAEEGGPGYPATGSIGDYTDMLGAKLLRTHNLLVVDERGTGRSTLIDCKPLRAIHVVTTTPSFRRDVRRCGHSLNDRFARQGGGFVHASDLFTTANAARDMARVLNALEVATVDLYGDSYGTYFAQSFLSHFPQRVRSVTLDSAYEARALDPWYRTTVTTARRAFDRVCRGSAACHRAAPGRSWQRIVRLAWLLRRHPLAGRAPGVDARLVRVRMNITALVNLVNDAGYDTDPYRQLDAAARAYLQRRDAVPLLRLWAQDIGYDYSDYNASPRYYTDGEYFAVGCSDYPQLFDMRASPHQRRQQFGVAVRHYPAHAFAPFSVREWVRVDPFTETYHACTDWPRQVHRADPPVVPHVSMDASHAPVLILNGALDSLTPAAGGAHIRRQIGANARHVVTANTVHLVAVDNPHRCGRQLVRRFITHPAALHTLDASCARQVPRIRAVGSFPRLARQAAPMHGHAPLERRRLAAVALAAAGDAARRYDYVDGNRDLGLRGGRVRYHLTSDRDFVIAHLLHARWTDDATVSGRVSTPADGRWAGAGRLTVRARGHPPLQVGIFWRHGHAIAFRHKKTWLTATAP